MLTLPAIAIILPIGVAFILLIYNIKSLAKNTRIAEATIETLKNDLDRIQTKLTQELIQVRDLRKINGSLSQEIAQLKHNLDLSRKQIRDSKSTSIPVKTSTSIKANTTQSSPALIYFATQVLKFLADTVDSLGAVPYHADEHYRKEYLFELEEGSKLIDTEIAELYHESTQRLFTYWAPIIQGYILSQRTDKNELLTAKEQVVNLQAQLKSATSVAINSNGIKLKISQELEAVRKEAEQAKSALTKQLASIAPDTKEAYEKLLSGATALTTAYAARCQSTFFEISTTGKFKYCCLYSYLPKRAQATAQQERDRELVLSFKNGVNTHEVAYLIGIALLRCFTPIQLQSMSLVVIPASTAAKNRLRYENFCAYVSEYTGLVNGFEYIGVAQDREPLKGNTTANKVANLAYNSALIKGCHILLFDDVMTTGGSFTQNAARLVENGATKVTGVFLARCLRV